MKIRIGSAYPRKEQLFIDVKGRNLISGLPQALVVGSNEMIDALEEPLQSILESVRNLFERTPPELASDITGKRHLPHRRRRPALRHGQVHLRTYQGSLLWCGRPHLLRGHRHGKALENLDAFSSSAIYDYKRGEYFDIQQ